MYVFNVLKKNILKQRLKAQYSKKGKESTKLLAVQKSHRRMHGSKTEEECTSSTWFENHTEED